MAHAHGSLGFLMYLADAFGYLGYVLVLFTRGYWPDVDDHRTFFQDCVWWLR